MEQTAMEKIQEEAPQENKNTSTTEEEEIVAEDENAPQEENQPSKESDDNEQVIDLKENNEQIEDEEIAIDDGNIPEYSEDVSAEDFKEFISVALEELSAGEEMAEAIITEMQKIAQAQPNHLDQVKYFYRECAQNSTLSSDNQRLCREFLEKIDGR